jgi:copper chaperone NosL
MNTKLSAASRLLSIVAGIAMIAVLFVPMWSIELNAPQYPEGLNLLIHANGLRGNVEIINGLNHYIGMKTLHDKDFIEFTILPYCIMTFAALFILVSIFNKRKFLNITFTLFVAFGVIAMADFWRWEYNYGHNLNPNAAIIVPGMSYQPPLLGFKQLLNFGAYSIPDLGGWIFIGAGILLLIAVLIEFLKTKKRTLHSTSLLLISGLLFISSCQSKPVAIVVGKDNCYFCKMTISDNKYGAEILTKKGKAYKFDDMHCLLAFIETKELPVLSSTEIFLVDYSSDHHLISADNCFLIQSDSVSGPMNGHIIALSNKEKSAELAANYDTKAISWTELTK